MFLHPAPPFLLPGARTLRRPLSRCAGRPRWAAELGPGTPGLCERCPGRARGAPAPLRAAERAAPHPPVRTRGAAPGAGFAFHVEGKRCTSALFRPPLPRAMRRRIKSREIGRAAGGFTGGCAVPRALRSTPVPNPAPARPAVSGP